MRRYLIFALLGPPLGLLVGLFVLLPLLNGGEFDFDFGNIALLPAAYLLGMVPALLAAQCDSVLATRGTKWRSLWTALAAYVLSFLPIAAALAHTRLGHPVLLLHGLVGAIPGYVCSRLAGGPRPPAP